MDEGKFGTAGNKVVIEDFLKGEEASVLAVTDGVTIYPLAPAQDHKAIFDGDKGPNTGGMGAYSPAPVVTDDVMEKVMQRILRPLVDGLRADGVRYKGILYAGLMIDGGEPSVVEFNVRFGDPETQAVLPRLKTDLITVFMAVAQNRLSEIALEWSDQACVCVVLASQGYPGDYKTGFPINGISEADEIPGCHVVQAGTKMGADGQLRSSGGRVLGVVGTGPTIAAAKDVAYKGIGNISFENMYFRRDIGWKAL
jgi:phosphoribosylamine--glycine ligase